MNRTCDLMFNELIDTLDVRVSHLLRTTLDKNKYTMYVVLYNDIVMILKFEEVYLKHRELIKLSTEYITLEEYNKNNIR